MEEKGEGTYLKKKITFTFYLHEFQRSLYYILHYSLNYYTYLSTNLKGLQCELTGIMRGEGRVVGLTKGRYPKLLFPDHFPPPLTPYSSAILHTHLLLFLFKHGLCLSFLPEMCSSCPFCGWCLIISISL